MVFSEDSLKTNQAPFTTNTTERHSRGTSPIAWPSDDQPSNPTLTSPPTQSRRVITAFRLKGFKAIQARQSTSAEPLDFASVMKGKPPVWRPFVSPKTDSNLIKRGQRTPGTEQPVAKCSRFDAAENCTYSERILSNIRILVRGLQSYSLHFQAFTVHQMEQDLNLDAAHSEKSLRRIQNNLLDECRTRLVDLEWREFPSFKDLDWNVT